MAEGKRRRRATPTIVVPGNTEQETPEAGPEVFLDHLSTIRNKRKAAGAASVEAAGAFKSFADAGGHKGAARWVIQLLEMDEDKRTRHLRAFDLYRQAAEIDDVAQGELPAADGPVQGHTPARLAATG
ncbi:MAG: hypothetical protein OES69_02375 [Myxococcales bacterium]|nr:hypothetical protein [Myxococcales bacterium]